MNNKNSANTSSSSSPQKNEKLSLSGNVLKMKFMQRKSKSLGASPSASSAVIKDNNSSSNGSISESMSFLDTKISLKQQNDSLSNHNNIFIDINLYSLLPGRRSFGGFNKHIEKNYDEKMNDNSIPLSLLNLIQPKKKKKNKRSNDDNDNDNKDESDKGKRSKKE